MTIYYSAHSAGFFDDEFHDVVPDDAVRITTEQHRQLLADQSQGKLITCGADGLPVAVERPPLPLDALLEALRAERNRLLTACDYTQIPDAPITDDEREAWRLYRQALRDLPEATPDPASPEWPTPPSELEFA